MRWDDGVRDSRGRRSAYPARPQRKLDFVDIVGELLHSRIGWLALLGLTLLVVGGTTMQGILPVVPGLVITVVAFSQAASRVRERRENPPPD